MRSRSEAKRLFLEASDLPPEEREAFLRKLAGGDPILHARVRSLLAAHERVEGRSTPTAVVLAGAPEDRRLPSRFGDYELLEEIGSGGSGVVYRARQLHLRRTVAIKLLRAGRFATDAEVRRFQSEAAAAARLDHPAIVPVIEAGTHEGRPYLSMKLVEGASLDRCAERYRGDPRAAARLVVTVARAVDHGHRRGVLHRDLKPSNVLIDEAGRPYVTDFGTAKLLDDTVRHTVTGTLLGTPSYMAPEQVTSDGEVTVATDVYALGCILYELLVGRPPLEAQGLAETLQLVQSAEPKRLRNLRPDVPRDLETICHTCLAKEPERRYATAAALAEDLERWLGFEPIRARPTSLLERARLAWRRRPLVAALTAAVALLFTTLVVGTLIAGVELRAGLERVDAAESSARERLRAACLAEARAERRGGLAGRRGRSLDLLGRAAAIRPGPDLIREAVANLALTDLVPGPELVDAVPKGGILRFDHALERYVSCAPDGTTELHRTADGALLADLTTGERQVHAVRFSRDGRYLALVRHGPSREDPRFDVWDLDAGEIVYTVATVPSTREVDFAPDRPILAAAIEPTLLLELDLVTGGQREVARFSREEAPRLVRYSPAGDRIAVLGWDQRVRMMDLASGAIVSGPGWIFDLTWNEDGSAMFGGGTNFRGHVWETATGALAVIMSGHGAEVVRAWYLRPDLVATYSWDRTTRLWDAKTGEQLLQTEEELIAVSSDGNTLAFSTGGSVRFEELRRDEVLRTLRGHGGKDPGCLDVSSDGRWAATGGHDGVLLWDLETMRSTERQLRRDVTSLLFDVDGALLVGWSGGVERWVLAGGRVVGEPLTISTAFCDALDRDGTGRRLAVLTSGELRISCEGRPDVVIPRPPNSAGLTLAPDGELVALGSWRGEGVHVWRTEDGAAVVQLSKDHPCCWPAFTPDGTGLVIGSDESYDVYATATWERAWSTPRSGGNRNYARATTFGPRGRLLAAVVGSWEIGLLDGSTGEEIVVLESPRQVVPAMARFTPDGRRLLVATTGRRVLVWDLVSLDRELLRVGLEPIGLVPTEEPAGG